MQIARIITLIFIGLQNLSTAHAQHYDQFPLEFYSDGRVRINRELIAQIERNGHVGVQIPLRTSNRGLWFAVFENASSNEALPHGVNFSHSIVSDSTLISPCQRLNSPAPYDDIFLSWQRYEHDHAAGWTFHDQDEYLRTYRVDLWIESPPGSQVYSIIGNYRVSNFLESTRPTLPTSIAFAPANISRDTGLHTDQMESPLWAFRVRIDGSRGDFLHDRQVN